MEKKTASAIMLTLLLTSIIALAFKIQPVRASGTIYIRANGSIDPPTTPIFTADNITYTLADNINDSLIVVQRSNIVIDGNGCVVQGFPLTNISNVTIKNTIIVGGGVYINSASYVVLSGNIITRGGVVLELSSNNTITENIIILNTNWNVYLTESSGNTISQNYIGGIEGVGISQYGIEIYRSSNNMVIQNKVTQCVRAIRMEGVIPLGELQSDASNNAIIENNIEHYEWGISLSESTNNTIVGNNITCLSHPGLLGESSGISLGQSHFNSIAQNIIESNYEGLKLVDSHFNNISQNNARYNTYGILLESSTFNMLCRNIITRNNYGILIQYSYEGHSNTLRYNNMTGNRYNFGVGWSSCYVQDVDETNTVDGKPVYYWVNRHDSQIPLDAGYVAIVNSTNIRVEGLTLENNYQGILIAYSNNITIRQNNVTNNRNGICLEFSFNNTVLGNNVTNNDVVGVSLRESCNNNIYRNNVINPYETGISLDRSSNNTLSQNNISNNTNGICLFDSLNNTISGNNITFNYDGIWLVISYSSSLDSSSNRFYHNNFINNTNHVGFGPKSVINSWDDGYPSGGNYWSDYVSVDVKNGIGQDLPGSDGIGDTPYVIDADNVDRYPLMNPYGAPPPPTYSLTITATVGGTTDPAPETYSYTANSTVQVTVIPEANYLFDYWELDSVNVGSANPYSVHMDKDHTLKAIFSPIPPPLSVSISPLSASILVGQSVTFTSTVSGGYTPYSYQWYLNGNPVSGATSNTWTFTPAAGGIYYIHLKVTDAKANTAQSETARITAATVPVGGYSIPIQIQTKTEPIIPYIALIAALTAIFTKLRPKTKRKR
jgi:parallel beta-helix repeat protein